jgi:uncharacterized protein
MRFACGVLGLCLALLLCGCGESSLAPEDIGTVKVAFPDGKYVRAQRLTHQLDMAAGLKWRTQLSEDRGMLFVFGSEVMSPFWTYEVKVPLDIVFMGADREIRRIVSNVPPCPGPREKCPTYGADQPAMYVLEVAAGVAAKHHLSPGMRLDF